MAHTLQHRRSGRGATFIEYGILMAIAVVIGLVIVKVIFGGLVSSGKKHGTTTTVARVVKHATHHAPNATAAASAALGTVVRPVLFVFAFLFAIVMFMKLVRWVAMGGFTPAARTTTARSVDSEGGERASASAMANYGQFSGALSTIAGTSAPSAAPANSLADSASGESTAVHQVHVGAVSGHKERWHRKASGQPKFR